MSLFVCVQWSYDDGATLTFSCAMSRASREVAAIDDARARSTIVIARCRVLHICSLSHTHTHTHARARVLVESEKLVTAPAIHCTHRAFNFRVSHNSRICARHTATRASRENSRETAQFTYSIVVYSIRATAPAQTIGDMRGGHIYKMCAAQHNRTTTCDAMRRRALFETRAI